MPSESNIIIKNARVNNLKDVSLKIPRGKLTVITGVSGSGKSSLAFDTLFAEGQRRFAESLSSYARQFLGRMSKPDVDKIEGIPPAVAIEQKVNVKNPRSTVATTTEIYDYLRLIYARIGRTYSPVSGREVKKQSAQDIAQRIMSLKGQTAYILAPMAWSDTEGRIELLLSLKEQGYARLWTDRPERIEDVLSAKKLPEKAMLLVDRINVPEEADEDFMARLHSSVRNALEAGEGRARIISDGMEEDFSTFLEADGMTFRDPDEYMFSFNSPLGACTACGGLGKVIGVSEDLVIPDKDKSIYDGAIACWKGERMGWFKEHLVQVAPRYGIRIFVPYSELSAQEKDILWNCHSTEGDDNSIIGINEFFSWVEANRYKVQYKFMLNRFSGRTVCPTCKGSRLRPDALWVRVGGHDIHSVLRMTAAEALAFFSGLDLGPADRAIAGKAIEEVTSRLQYICDVGLPYLSLDRACNSLSGGESQRVNLVTALGNSLVGSMYILDEPSIGLHPRDTAKLIAVLRKLRDLGNTVIVVEHDEDIIRAADHLIDLGPLAGGLGGEIVFEGSPDRLSEGHGDGRSLTVKYLSGEIARVRRKKRSWNYSICVEGARHNNLKDIDVRFPLSVLTVVSGVSGSGKSSLVGDILYPALRRRLTETGELPGLFRKLSGNLDRINRVEYVDQNPIGRSSRSNAVTYLKVYDDIRKLFASQKYAKLAGYTPSHFSFNQDGGRCPECQGDGFVKIEMQFMADVTMVCESCGGKRFKPDILEVRYQGKNIDDILNMSVSEAIDFFSSCKEEEAAVIARKLQPLVDVGLQYIKLGQASSTLSGGESQRIKLASFLSLSRGGSKEKILFIFDEPTTGLHFADVEKLLKAFDVLLAEGHSIIVIEHNTDVIRAADWVIELGPEGGDAGGCLVFEGKPEDMAASGSGYTARFIANLKN